MFDFMKKLEEKSQNVDVESEGKRSHAAQMEPDFHPPHWS